MGNITGNLQPQELSDFRKLQTNTTVPLDIPERPENRSCTDQKFLVVFIITIILLFPFLIYTLVYSDINRLTFNSDTCGNLCGVDNSAVKGIACSGVNLTKKTFVQYEVSLNMIQENDWTLYRRICVKKCPAHFNSLRGSFCFPPSQDESIEDEGSLAIGEFEELWHWDKVSAYLRASWWKFIVGILVTTVLCFGTTLLLRYLPAIVVWSVLCLTLCFFLAITVASWIPYFASKKEVYKVQLRVATVFTTFFVVFLLLTVFFFRRIKLIVLLYKEATKAIFAMPLIILVPVVIFLAELIVFILFATTTTYMYSAGKLSKDNNSTIYSYEPDAVMKFTLAFNFVVFLWVTLFISGCQYVVIAGTISSWYFAKNKHYLGTPIWTSTSNLFNFHLGSVAFGSLVITIITLIRAFLQILPKNAKIKPLVDCCMGMIEGIFKFLTKNVYIVTAIHGQSFYKSGKRAFKLLVNNALNLIALNFVGSFVLGLIQVLLIVVSTGIAYALFMGDKLVWIGVVICFLINFVIIITMFSVFSATIDTLFICFCEDSAINDGISRPYFMNKGLMEFFETSKAIFPEKIIN